MSSQLSPLTGLLALISVAFASSFMPTRALMTARMLLTRRGRPNALAYVAANWAWRVVLGGILLSALGFDAQLFARWGSQSLRMAAGLAAIVFAVLAIVQWRFGGHLIDARLAQWSERLDGLGPVPVFWVTLAIMVLPGTQWLFVAAGCAVIHATGVPAPVQLVALMGFAAAQLVMVASPLFLRRDTLERHAERVYSRAAGHGVALFATLSVVCATIAVRA